MKLLCISTSGPMASAALILDGGTVECLTDSTGRGHCETIMPLVDALLSGNGLGTYDIDAFAADIGPGSFTGVRIGVCAVNALGAAAGRPVIGVSSLEALYYNLSAYGNPVCALIDARNKNAYAALLQDGEYLFEPEAVYVEHYLKRLPAGVTFIGSGAAVYREAIENAAASPLFAPEADNDVRASSAALAACNKYKSGLADRRVLPLYLRPSQAERVFAQRKGGN